VKLSNSQAENHSYHASNYFKPIALFKQYEKNLLHAGETELNNRSALKETLVPEDKYEEPHIRLGNHIKFTVAEGEVTSKSNEVWKGFVIKMDAITSLLSGFGDVKGILYAGEHKTE